MSKNVILVLNISWLLFGVVHKVDHFKWVPCHHVTARPLVADGGEGLQMWKVGESTVLNKKSWTAGKEWHSSLGVGREAIKSSQ
jgi:hypothetical protein